ncbi:MAG: hypothetical protein COW19_00985 [Zetaproteobacteria bacterium CG12_big_fil_rev_8_21_14_0_65_55_1124]|nr:MAG: hypothetical protein AUJ58_08580 [Zetaproteobacteria bacterium CG1_02_55_237]PIS20453.1 MAG: hypothetical protein COT53_00035 [Zetaproteobacteria bacterium CG08_land_8_20_14_0_20_55_17]PIW43732.1 MAG: hypothetical protein COW19_00985 [Zetaproteobacteria bacterium CG12_big_fil_rev_8_21_14_0_65_55_1124]PIY53268.1 MAG: hypothetical protein COZ01_04190 [Zetaproteobacteria bacterium CG_4_10_14_0_8_um_filter_55_43]PIZ40160.1 MAG: hypothetical protein COY36_00785 [Zetaproteobacteria bacterium 
MSKFSLFGAKAKKTGKSLREDAGRELLAGNYAQALELFIQCHEEKPDDMHVYAKVAELRAKTGDAEGAVADYSKIAKAYAEQGFVVQAIAISKIILRIDPSKTEIKDKLRKLSEERGGGKDDDSFASVAPGEGHAADNLRSGLAKTPLLSGMSGEQLESFVESLELRNVAAGEGIWQAGSPGEYLYLIGMGQVSLLATDAQGRKQVFSQLKEGDFFGERSFMARTAHKDDAIADVDCTILMLDRDTFDNWVAKYPEIGTTVEEFYRQRVLARVLAITPVFEGVPSDARIALADQFTLRTFEDGELIMKEGEIGDTFYLIRSGSVALTVTGPSGDVVFSATLSEGEFVGEVALLTGRPRTATIFAKGSVELMELSRSAFDLLTEKHPSVREVVQSYLRKRAEETIQAIRQRPAKS